MSEDLLALGREWWVDDGSGTTIDRVDEIFDDEPALIPTLICRLVETVPVGQSISYIGTSVVEDLEMRGIKPADLATLFRLTELDPATMTRILSGVWPELLEKLEIAFHFRGILSSAQINYLLSKSPKPAFPL